MGSDFSRLLFLSIRYAPPFTWLDTSPSRPLSSSSHWRSSPSSLLPPSSSPTSARRLPPLPPCFLFSLSLSLYRAPHPSPLTCRLAACLVSSLLHPLPRCHPLPPSSDFPSAHGFPPPTPPFPPFPLPGRLLLLSYGPGVGVPPPSGVKISLVNSTAMHVLLPLPLLLTLLPPLGLLLTRLPPLSLRLWVIQRLLCFLPLLPVFQGVIPVPLVPSPPPLAVGSAGSSCCSNFVCFCALFPLTLRVTPSASLQLVLFLFFLPPAALMSPSLPLHCYGCRRSSLLWVDCRWASFLSSGHPVTRVLPQLLTSWALQCYFALCRQCQFLCPSFLISSVLFVRLACGRLRPLCLSAWGVLPCPVGGLDGHVGLLMCCVRLPARFSSLWSCSLPPPCHGSPMCLARQAQVSSSHIAFLVLYPRICLISPPGFCSWSLAGDLFTCGACGFSLSGAGRYLLLQAPRSSFSLRSPQYLVAVASRCSFTSSSFLGRLGSPPRSLASTLSASPSILRFSLSCLCAGAVSLSHSLLDLAVSSTISWRDSRLSPSPGSSFSCQFLAFPIPGPFSWCGSMRWVPSSCCFSCYPLLPGCASCAWGVRPPFSSSSRAFSSVFGLWRFSLWLLVLSV